MRAPSSVRRRLEALKQFVAIACAQPLMRAPAEAGFIQWCKSSRGLALDKSAFDIVGRFLRAPFCAA